MNFYKESELLALEITSINITEAILLGIPILETIGGFTPAKTGQKFTVKLHPFRDEAKRQMDRQDC